MSDTGSQQEFAIPEELMLSRLAQSEQLREFFVAMWQQNPGLAARAGSRIRDLLSPAARTTDERP